MSSFVRKSTLPAKNAEPATKRTAPCSTVPNSCRLGSTGSSLWFASTGIPSFDQFILGGEGLPTCTLVGIHEDRPRSLASHASTMAKCFVAEGIVSGHPVCIINAADLFLSNQDQSAFLRSLPSPCGAEEGPASISNPSLPTDNNTASLSPPITNLEKLSIAWRYKHIMTGATNEGVTSSLSKPVSKMGHAFDLGRHLDYDKKVKAKAQVKLFLTELSRSSNLFNDAFSFVDAFVKEHSNPGILVRIVIMGLGAPEFQTENIEEQCKFMHRLSNLLQSSQNVVGLVTIPAFLYQSNPLSHSLHRQVDHYCQVVVEVQSFATSTRKSDPALAEYDGFLRLLKPLRLPGTLKLLLPESMDLAFKVKRRRFLVEKFHLPPDLGESVSRSSGCSTTSSTPNQQLEF